MLAGQLTLTSTPHRLPNGLVQRSWYHWTYGNPACRLLRNGWTSCQCRITLIQFATSDVHLLTNYSQIICLLYVDKWGRKKTLWITGIIMTIDMALILAMTAAFSEGTNRVGQGWAIAFIFLFSIM